MEWTTISATQAGDLVLYLGGLVACWATGFKVGALVRALFKMGQVL